MTHRPRPRRLRERRGMALMITLASIVILLVLSSGAMMGSLQDFRAGRNTLVEQRAFAVAEYGLNSEVSNWERGRNLPPPRGMAFGAIDSSSVFVAQGDTAYVKVTRLNDNTFWVVSTGRASMGTAQLESQRRTSMLVRIAYPTIRPGGAIVTAGGINMRGSAEVDGRDNDPSGWTQCTSIAKNDTLGIAVAPGQTVNIQKPGNLTGSPSGWAYDAAAADSNTYVRYGTESWNSLVANADIRLGSNAYAPEPIGTSSTCDEGVLTNWGEPNRGSGSVVGCQDYFPIIYIDGDATINGNGRGQGILLVNGNIRINGTMDWYGLIVARNDIDAGNGTANVYGSVMSRNAIIDDGSSLLAGTSNFYWSSCALESALRGSAILTRVRDRAWAQLY